VFLFMLAHRRRSAYTMWNLSLHMRNPSSSGTSAIIWKRDNKLWKLSSGSSETYDK
jgi:hypothetical protein